MKSITSIIMIAILIFLIVDCGSESDKVQTKKAQTTIAPTTNNTTLCEKSLSCDCKTMSCPISGKCYEQNLLQPGFVTQAKSWLVAEYDTGQILAGKDIDTARPVASLTKVMTAYVLFNKELDKNGSTTFDAKHKAVYHYFRIVPGEKILNEHLLYSMLVSSLNTPVHMLVSSVAPNDSNFVTQMNRQARKWGLKKTKFVEPCGIDQNNKSTAREYLSIFRKTVHIPEIRSILGMKQYEYHELIDLDEKSKHYDKHSNHLVAKYHKNFTVLASKTGYNHEAGACLAMLVKRKVDGKKFVIVTLNDPDRKNNFAETEQITNWGINLP